MSVSSNIIFTHLFGRKVSPKRKFQSQLVAVPSAIHFDRTRMGKDSPRYTQAVAKTEYVCEIQEILL